MQLFGAPFCSKVTDPPRKILEVACGSALWSSSCHEFFKHQNVSFTGLDIAPIPPDLRKIGINWRFVQHDLRKWPLPFDDEEFDLIFVNNEFVLAGENVTFNPVTALTRYLKRGGIVEVWRTDLQFRCLQPDPPVAVGTSAAEADLAEKTATYTIGPATPFTKSQNRYLQDFNVWVENGLKKFGLTATPCAMIAFDFASDTDLYQETGSRRLAIPFGPVRWENEDTPVKHASQKPAGRGKGPRRPSFTVRKRARLTAEQAALRRSALDIIIGFIESMEPILVEESGKTQDEWDRWWAGLNTDLLENDGLFHGECLELGAWWARKA